MPLLIRRKRAEKNIKFDCNIDVKGDINADEQKIRQDLC